MVGVDFWFWRFHVLAPSNIQLYLAKAIFQVRIQEILSESGDLREVAVDSRTANLVAVVRENANEGGLALLINHQTAAVVVALEKGRAVTTWWPERLASWSFSQILPFTPPIQRRGKTKNYTTVTMNSRFAPPYLLLGKKQNYTTLIMNSRLGPSKPK